MGNSFCYRDKNDETLSNFDEKQICDLIERYKPDRALCFNDNQFKVKIIQNADNPSSISNFSNKRGGFMRKTMLKSLRPSYTLDFEKKQRKILV